MCTTVYESQTTNGPVLLLLLLQKVHPQKGWELGPTVQSAGMFDEDDAMIVLLVGMPTRPVLSFRALSSCRRSYCAHHEYTHPFPVGTNHIPPELRHGHPTARTDAQSDPSTTQWRPYGVTPPGRRPETKSFDTWIATRHLERTWTIYSPWNGPQPDRQHQDWKETRMGPFVPLAMMPFFPFDLIRWIRRSGDGDGDGGSVCCPLALLRVGCHSIMSSS